MDAPRLPVDRRRPETELQALVEHSLVGLAIIQDARYIYVNQKYCEIFGYARDELPQGAKLLDVVADADRALVAANMAKRLSGAATVVEYSVKGKRKDGAIIDVVVLGAVMAIGGRPALIASIMDVTQHRRTEAELRQQQEETKRERDTAQRYLDIANVMILVLNVDETVALINRQGCKILGYDGPEEILGKSWIDFFIPERMREAMRGVFHRLVGGEGSGVAYHEYPVLTRTGEERLIAWHNARIRDDSGAVIASLSSGEDITKQRWLDENLRLSEARFRSLFEEAPDAILVHDLGQDRFIDANRKAEELFECDRQELLRLGPPHFYSPDQLDGRPVEESFAEHFRRAVGGEDVKFERRIRTAKGKDRFCEVQITSLASLDRKLVRASYVDITERKLAAEKIREDETQIRALVEQGVAAIFVIQDDMTIGYQNRHFAELLGYSREEVVGRQLRDFVAEADRAMVGLAVQELFSGKAKSIQLVAMVKRKDGVLVDLLAHGAMADFRGRPAIFGVGLDVTERRHADEARAQLAAIVESSRSAIISGDRDAICTSWNIGAERIYGYSAEEMIGQPVAVLVPADRQGELRDQIARVLSGGDIVNFETVRMPKSGRRLHVSETISPIRNPSGAIVGASAIVIDISDRKRAERALKRTVRALMTLSQANSALVRATSQEGLFQEMCRVIVEVGGYRMAWIGFAEQDAEKTVRPIASAGHDEGYLDLLNLSWADNERGRTPVGIAIRTGSLQLNKDVASNPLITHLRAEALKRGYKSSIALPLREAERVFGAIAIYAAEPDAFGADEVKLLSELADDLSYGIMALRARAEREAALQRLERAMEETVEVVASTVEMRDAYTAGHQRQVTMLAVAVAAAMGLSDERIHGLRLASSVHDLGKIHVPAEILSKPGKLTAFEYELIKTHPQVGYEILKPVKFPWPIAEIVRQHHERLDGSGYPQGLKGDAILLEARIIAVADVVESMISHRPYRPGLGIDRALAEIEQGKGRLYDSAAVDACVKLFRVDNFKFD